MDGKPQLLLEAVVEHPFCSLEIRAGTTGECGGDSGHGGRTYFEIVGIPDGGIDIECKIIHGGRGVRIDLGGDAELEICRRALRLLSNFFEFAVEAKFLREEHRDDDLCP